MVSVTVDLLASTTATVIEVHADDAVGRFAELASILADGGYDVRTARATTIGDRIVDVFYVCDASGRIVDPAAIARSINVNGAVWRSPAVVDSTR